MHYRSIDVVYSPSIDGARIGEPLGILEGHESSNGSRSGPERVERTVGRGALIDPKLELKLPPAQLAWGELQSHGITAETDDDCWVPKVNAIIIASVPIGWGVKETHKECCSCAYPWLSYAYNV